MNFSCISRISSHLLSTNIIILEGRGEAQLVGNRLSCMLSRPTGGDNRPTAAKEVPVSRKALAGVVYRSLSCVRRSIGPAHRIYAPDIAGLLVL